MNPTVKKSSKTAYHIKDKELKWRRDEIIIAWLVDRLELNISA
jgi:hypothetical protein